MVGGKNYWGAADCEGGRDCFGAGRGLMISVDDGWKMGNSPGGEVLVAECGGAALVSFDSSVVIVLIAVASERHGYQADKGRESKYEMHDQDWDWRLRA